MQKRFNIATVVGGTKNEEMLKLVCSVCCDCQYIGDKYSFPLPNDMVLIDQDNPFVKRFYCCNGDCKWYTKDITGEFIKNCDCFEEL